jgi:cytochrome oxidase assembly protein ShyY1
VVKGERGLEIITPLYTGIDKQGRLTGILVNRGRIPFEYKESKLHLTEPGKETVVEGVIFMSEGACKYADKAPGRESVVRDFNRTEREL